MNRMIGFASTMCAASFAALLFATPAPVLAAAGLPAVGAEANDADPSDCAKNHFILGARVDCWQPTGPLHAPRAGHTATLLRDGRVLVAGGQGDAGTSAEIYDPSTGQWTLAAPLPIWRQGHVATLLADGRVLLLGGNTTYTPAHYLGAVFVPGVTLYGRTADIYDPVSNTWTVIPGPLEPRYDFTATLLANGKVLVTGGLDESDSPLGSCELYDPLTGEWTQTGSFTRGEPTLPITYFWKRWDHRATLLADGRVLVTGGMADDWTMDALAEAELYDPATGLWTLAGSMSVPRAYHTTSLLADGRAMVVGGDWRGCHGDCFEVALASTEIYDPRTNGWSAGPQLATARASHTATLLRDGTLLAIGGYHSVGWIPDLSIVMNRDAEASAASALPWGPAAPLRTARDNPTATPLGDGSVLVVGGFAIDTGQALGSAEIYRHIHAP